MSNDLVRVDPQSVEEYGRLAQAAFEAIHERLVRLVRDAVEVDYFGPNAVTFKTKCGEMASEFGASCSKSLSAISEAVRVASSNISQSLGGRAISITLDGAAIPLPSVPQGDGTVQMRTSGLTELISKVGSHMGSVRENLDTHLVNLKKTDWQSRARDEGVEAVSSYTTKAKHHADEAEQAIVKFITEQIEAVERADR
jgi:hypothetical protein